MRARSDARQLFIPGYERWNLSRASKECGLPVYTLAHFCREDVVMRRAWKARRIGSRWYVDAAAFRAWSASET